MDTAVESRGIGHTIVRVLIYAVLIAIGLCLFAAAGIGGGLLALNWLV